MSDAGDQAAAKGTSLHGQGGNKADPVTRIEPELKKGGTRQIIDYCYKQEDGDNAKFEFRPAVGKNGHEGVFTVTRSSSSSNNVLDVSKVIEDTVFKKIVLKDQKLKKKKKVYRVKFEIPKGLDLEKYFMIKSDRQSSSDEEKR